MGDRPGLRELEEIGGLFEAGAVAVKLFWGYALDRRTRALVYNSASESSENLVLPPNNGDILALCREVARVDGLLGAHCEDRGIIDAAERALGHHVFSYADLLEARRLPLRRCRLQ